jgi:hypothetical protein
MATATEVTAHMVAQRAVKDRLVSGQVHETIKNRYWTAARYTTEGSQHPGDLLEQRLFRLENPSGQQVRMFDLGPGQCPPHQ